MIFRVSSIGGYNLRLSVSLFVIFSKTTPEFNGSSMALTPVRPSNLNNYIFVNCFQIVLKSRYKIFGVMVSTRQSSSVGGGGENAGVSEAGLSKTVRHNNSQPPPLSEASMSAHTVEVTTTQSINLMDLPPEILLKILGSLSFRNVAHLRPVRFLFSLCVFFFLYVVHLHFILV